jgi:hypothetical protein
MDFVHLATEIEERYRRYLRTTFYIRDGTTSSFFSSVFAGRPLVPRAVY